MDRATDTTAIFEQAEHWFARMRAADCPAADRHAFHAWQAADPSHASAYAETERLWSDLAPLAADVEMARWRREALAVANPPPAPSRRIAWGLAAAAGVLLVLATGAFVAWRALPPAAPVITHYATAAGEVRQVALADGSHLTLNADTTLDVAMGHDARTVNLLRGEAVFDVAHEPRRPFIVHAAGNAIRDVGTRFDVNLDRTRADITVVEGVVNVTRAGRSATLTRGDQLAAGVAVWQQRRIDPSVATGWTHGMLIFRQTPLAEAVAQANRYGSPQLVVADPSLADIRISGDFRVGETNSLVRALQAAFPIRARHDRASDETRLYRR